MKRRLIDHVEANTDGSYYFRGGFNYQAADDEGRIVQKEVIGDAKEFELFSGQRTSAYQLALATTASLIAATSMII